MKGPEGRKRTDAKCSFVLSLRICFRTLPFPSREPHPSVFTSLHSPHGSSTALKWSHGERWGDGQDLGCCSHRYPAEFLFLVTTRLWVIFLPNHSVTRTTILVLHREGASTVVAYTVYRGTAGFTGVLLSPPVAGLTHAASSK